MGVLPISVLIKARRVNYLQSILKHNKTGMLYSFFLTQWYNPCRGDWTEQVKDDLEDLGITYTLDHIEKKSKEGFKTIVKAKAKELALKNLLSKKESHSKLDNITYRELKIQEYFKSDALSIPEKMTIFRCRVRMERFGENFRGGNLAVMCPLCKLHLDNQAMAYQCPAIKKEMEVKGCIEDMYKEEIKLETVRTMTRILEIRQKDKENG